MKVIDDNSSLSKMNVMCFGIRYESTGCGRTLEISPQDVENERSEAYITCPICGAKTFINPKDMPTKFYEEWIKLKK